MLDKRSKGIIETIVKLSKTCRECSHQRYAHLSDEKCIDVGRVNEDRSVWYTCTCEGFVPEDNLDYIEWLAKKRGLIK
jgi:hypothetical protein